MGRVFLVGAGPGAPDLLTLKAARILGEADLVLYDALIDREILELAPRAKKFFVGKRAGLPSTSQKAIHALMIRAAREGKVVVRLKAGDPFVLGRGGEEVIACEEAGVEVQVVSGVTSAIAAAASVGIPVTHRGIAPGFLVLSAVPNEHYRVVLGSLAPGSVTVVMMMALAARGKISAFLCDHGWSASMPAAIILGATGPRSWVWTGTLAELANVTWPEEKNDLPGMLVIGPVVSLANIQEEAPWLKQAR